MQVHGNAFVFFKAQYLESLLSSFRTCVQCGCTVKKRIKLSVYMHNNHLRINQVEVEVLYLADLKLWEHVCALHRECIMAMDRSCIFAKGSDC